MLTMSDGECLFGVLLCSSPGALDHHISLTSARAGDRVVMVQPHGPSSPRGMIPKRNPGQKVEVSFPGWYYFICVTCNCWEN